MSGKFIERGVQLDKPVHFRDADVQTYAPGFAVGILDLIQISGFVIVDRGPKQGPQIFDVQLLEVRLRFTVRLGFGIGWNVRKKAAFRHRAARKLAKINGHPWRPF